MRDLLCPICHGFARVVSAAVVYPEDSRTLDKIYHCPNCQVFARTNREGEPIEGMADKALHGLRKKVMEKIEGWAGGDKVHFFKEMNMKPWNQDILQWDKETCLRALNTVLNQKVRIVRGIKDLLS